MPKKRKLSISPVKIEVKEEHVEANDYLTAKGRLKGVLKQLTEQSSDEESESSDYEKTPKNENKRRKQETVPPPFHHTYVMKLYDRSVDLARFEEDTPLYPLCRAWMENQPRNPQPIIKRRISSPNPDLLPWYEQTSIKKLPPPTSPFVNRIPSPLPEQKQQKEEINLDYEECPPVDKDTLIRNHLERWGKVKKNWVNTASKNESRYLDTFKILESVYNK